MSRKNRDFFREKLEFSGDISFCNHSIFRLDTHVP